jgi:hypothetical protein
MTHPSVLTLHNPKKLFVVKNDVSRVGIGAVLVQEGHLIAYISKPLGPK